MVGEQTDHPLTDAAGGAENGGGDAFAHRLHAERHGEEGVVDGDHRGRLVAFGDHQRDVELGRALGDGSNVDPVGAEDAEDPAGDSGDSTHGLADHRHHRELGLHHHRVDEPDPALELELRVHPALRLVNRAGFDGETDRVLARGLTDEDDADVAARKHPEEAFGDPGHTDHPVALEPQQGDLVDRGDAADLVAVAADLLDHAGAFEGRVEGVSDDERNRVGARRVEGGRVDHLGAEVGELHEFVVAQRRQREGARHQARIGAHDAVHIGPDLNAVRTEGGAEDRRRVVGPPAAQGRGLALGVGGDKTGDDLRRVARGKVLADPLPGGVEIHASVAELVIGHDETAGVTGFGGCPRSSQRRREELRRQTFAAAEDRVAGPRRALAHQGNAVQDPAELVDDFIDEPRDLFGLFTGQEIGGGRVVARPNRLHRGSIVIAEGGRDARGDEVVGDPGHRRDDDRRR